MAYTLYSMHILVVVRCVYNTLNMLFTQKGPASNMMRMVWKV
jgi:hypothetical protein